MRTSETTGQLIKALAEAQGKFPKIAKDKTAEVAMKSGGKYSYGYADLASVLDVIRPVLAEHKIAVVQAPDLDDEGRLLLISRLAHESAEWIESRYLLPVDASAQEMGSAITYARRYSLCALAGVTAEDDDDGQRAGKPSPQKSKPAAQPVQQRKAAAATPGSQGDLVARIRAVLPEDHPQYATLSAKSPKQLEALAKSLKIDVGSPAVQGLSDGRTIGGGETTSGIDDPAESPSPEGEGPGIEQVAASPSPEGHFGYWAEVAQKAELFPEQLLVQIQSLPVGQGVTDFRWLDPDSQQSKKIIAALGKGGKAA